MVLRKREDLLVSRIVETVWQRDVGIVLTIKDRDPGQFSDDEINIFRH